jgi:hypothetical protein
MDTAYAGAHSEDRSLFGRYRVVSFVIGLVDPAYRYMEQRHRSGSATAAPAGPAAALQRGLRRDGDDAGVA